MPVLYMKVCMVRKLTCNGEKQLQNRYVIKLPSKYLCSYPKSGATLRINQSLLAVYNGQSKDS